MEKFLEIVKSMEGMSKEELAKSLEGKKNMDACEVASWEGRVKSRKI